MAAASLIRIGILGAARVAPNAVIQPAAQLGSVSVAAVASRVPSKAQAFAASHGIPKAYSPYAALLENDAIDAVYIALPPSLHAEWALRALQRGKHVLCEKPLAADPSQAEAMVAVATRCRCVLQEGLHILYSPALRRLRDLTRAGTLGSLLHIESVFRHPSIPMLPDDFRLRPDLGGGAAMDLGCYSVGALRLITGEEPLVREVRLERAESGVDTWMQVRVSLPSGSNGVAEHGFRGAYDARFGVNVEFSEGRIRATFQELLIEHRGQVVRETIPPVSTYRLQLEAFARQVRAEPSDALPAEDAVATARVVNAMYERAGSSVGSPHAFK